MNIKDMSLVLNAITPEDSGPLERFTSVKLAVAGEAFAYTRGLWWTEAATENEIKLLLGNALLIIMREWHERTSQ